MKKELVISIFENSEGELQYDLYDSQDAFNNGDDCIDGGVCTSTMKNALEMAYELAKSKL